MDASSVADVSAQVVVLPSQDLGPFFNIAGCLMCVARHDGYFDRVNAEWTSVLGYRIEDLEGINFLSLIHPDDLAATQERMADLGGGGTVSNFQNRYRAVDGSYRTLEWHASGSGDVIVAVALDVSDRVQALAELRRSEEMHRNLFAATHQGVVYHNRDGAILDANPAAQSVLGLTLDQMQGRTSMDPLWRVVDVHGADLPGDQHAAMVTLRTGEAVRDQLMAVFNPQSNSFRWLRVNAIPLADGGEDGPAVQATFDDVTEWKRNEETLVEWNATLRSVLETHAITSITDADGLITEVNDRFCALTGYSREELLGRSHRILSSGTHDDDFFATMWKTISAGELWKGEICNRAKDGSLYWVAGTIVPLRGIDGAVSRYVEINSDITSHKMAEIEAAEASRAKSEFLANVSHEIRTPLNAVLGLTHVALERSDNPELRRILGTIQTSGQSLLGIINEVLDFSRIESGRTELNVSPHSVRAIVSDVVEMLGQQADSKGIVVVARVEPRVPAWLLVDGPRLRQIMLNLVGNAVKFTDVGTVMVSVDYVDGVALLTVADSGNGIPPAQIERIFEPFTQADDSPSRLFEGTGLGLSICRLLCQAMEGSIRCESTVGEGSTFRVALPLAPCDPPTRMHVEESQSRGITATGRVLVVEDNPINREVAAVILESAGLDVTLAESGPAAIDQIAFREFDVVLMDVQMPGMSGFEATRLIRDSQRGARLPIIALTAHALSGDRDKCLRSGMDDYLAKPYDPAELVDVVSMWASARKSSRPALSRAGTTLPSAFRGVHLHEGLHRLSGDEQLYLTLLRDLGRDVDALKTRIEAHPKGQGLEPTLLDLRGDIHRMRGAAMNLGLNELAEVLEKCERGTGEGLPDLRIALSAAEDDLHAIIEADFWP